MSRRVMSSRHLDLMVKLSGVLGKKTDISSMDYNIFVSSLNIFSGKNDKNNN